MDDKFLSPGIAGTATTSYDAGLRAHMLSVYNYMGGGLALTGVVAWIVANSPIAASIWNSPIRWLVIFAPLAFVMLMQFKMQSLSAATMRGLFFAYAAIMGLSLSILFLVYTNNSIARAFFITAATFGSMSLWGYTTKRDLTGFGGFLLMGLMGLFIASIVNLFLASTMLYWVSSIIGVCIFTGLTAWDTQRIKETYNANWGGETNDKLAVFGALRLYLDFINIFVNMLRFFGDRR